MCRAPYEWRFELWYDEELPAVGLNRGRHVRLKSTRCSGTDLMTVKNVQDAGRRVDLKSERLDISMPADVLAKLGADLYGDMSQTDACYVAGLVEACVIPRERERLLKAFR